MHRSSAGRTQKERSILRQGNVCMSRAEPEEQEYEKGNAEYGIHSRPLNPGVSSVSAHANAEVSYLLGAKQVKGLHLLCIKTPRPSIRFSHNRNVKPPFPEDHSSFPVRGLFVLRPRDRQHRSSSAADQRRAGKESDAAASLCLWYMHLRKTREVAHPAESIRREDFGPQTVAGGHRPIPTPRLPSSSSAPGARKDRVRCRRRARRGGRGAQRRSRL